MTLFDDPAQVRADAGGWISGPSLDTQQASRLRRGDRVELLAVPADPDYEHAGLNAGDRGAVELVDSLSTVHIRWDTGRHLGITGRHRDVIRRIGR